MPKIGPWRRKKPLISWENLGVDALNKYGEFMSASLQIIVADDEPDMRQ
jgi:hypothetical protein